MNMEEKTTKKRHNATVTFSRKEQKEEMLQHLNSVQLQNLMPDDVKGKDCLKVLWAVEYLHRLAVDGKIRVQVPMFEADSQEKQGLLDEIARLKAELEKIKKSAAWVSKQMLNTPEYAEDLLNALLSDIGS